MSGKKEFGKTNMPKTNRKFENYEDINIQYHTNFNDSIGSKDSIYFKSNEYDKKQKETYIKCVGQFVGYTALLTGMWEKFTTTLNTSNIIYDNFTFKDCYFLEKSWFDSCVFKKCNFINCIFKGDMRWIDFLSCEFENVQFDLSYIRASKIDKKCTLKNVQFNIEQIDEYMFVLGKKYKKDFWHQSEINKLIIE